MGIIIVEWHFAAGQAPPLATVLRRLEQRTGLRVAVAPAGDGEAEAGFTLLGESFTILREVPDAQGPAGDRITVEGGPPGNPFIWDHLQALMAACGGRPIDSAGMPAPDAAAPGFRQRWQDLPLGDRIILRLPPILAPHLLHGRLRGKR